MFRIINLVKSGVGRGLVGPFFVLFFVLFLLPACSLNNFFAIEEITTQAVQQAKPELCIDIRDKDLFRQDRRRDDCYLQVAQKISDPQICLKIKDAFQYDKCFLQLALDNQEEEICNQVKNETSRYRCYQEVALVSRRPELCVQAGNEYGRYACYTELAKLMKDPSICDNIDYALSKSQCLIGTALSSQDESICSRIECEERYSNQDSCYVLVAEAKVEPDICRQISDEVDKDECFHGVALAANDFLICDSIKDDGEYNDCVEEVASMQKDPSPCLQDKARIDAKTCIKGVVLLIDNIEICNNIINEELLAWCQEIVNLNIKK